LNAKLLLASVLRLDSAVSFGQHVETAVRPLRPAAQSYEMPNDLVASTMADTGDFWRNVLMPCSWWIVLSGAPRSRFARAASQPGRAHLLYSTGERHARQSGRRNRVRAEEPKSGIPRDCWVGRSLCAAQRRLERSL